MATNLLNRAQISYTGGSAVSNQTSTTLLDQYTMEVTKATLTSQVQAGDNAAYIISVENNGSGTLYNVSATDDLGASTASTTPPLTYVDDSVAFYINGAPSTGTAQTTADGVTFTADAPLDPNDILLIIYLASPAEDITGDVTNEVTITAGTSTATYAVITATANATITVTAFADVSIFKTADKTTVIAGDTLTYTFTLMNTGFEAVDEITFTDVLPAEFTVTGVSYTIDDVTTPLAPTDYSINASNELTIPAPGSTIAIGIPAATETGPGITTITVSGVIA